MKARKRHLNFMTWNLYLGADLQPILTSSFEQLSERIIEVLLQFLVTNFHTRVKTIARLIGANKPDIIGLQEVELFELFPLKLPSASYDFLQLLQHEFSLLGINYEVVAINKNHSLELPLNLGKRLRFIDRDVILMKKESRLRVCAVEEKNFRTNFSTQLAGRTFNIVRGWSTVDVHKNGDTFRVINTHLEPDFTDVQVAQGNELLDGPARTDLPLVVLGDLNSNADGSGKMTYENFLNEGFHDVWTEKGQRYGFTCCQHPNLLNVVSSLNRRIDFILYKNGWEPLNAIIVGNQKRDRTPFGLWPSDHAGVIARLTL
ncbi:endonuclease/exonuclease/phosphatase family protein [Anaerobacillus sp. MEB173]|uniref:endonuclease/exonuclease/phosphatase family protein n=1 Tax=Anaerobacillus sp. MEB173 TaxID=3383345 RepID=UPI003F8F51EE